MLVTQYLLGFGLAGAIVLGPRQNLPPNETDSSRFSLPDSENFKARSAELLKTRENFQYGPDVVAGEGVYYPTGSYADKMVNFDSSQFFNEQTAWAKVCNADGAAAAQAVAGAGGLKSLEDWFKFYDLGFKNSVPSGPYTGILANGTNDLTFSMERLSTGPFGLIRLKPGTTLSFKVDDSIAKKLTTMTQSQLLAAGRLFYSDYRDQADSALVEGRYAGASEAYFYIHPVSSQFLPLGIRLNRGSSLIYTPADSPKDWLFAKLGFNMNDLWFQQWYHLEQTHVLIDIVFEAAVRSLNADHPVYGIMDRLAFQTFAFRLSAIKSLINVGGPVDRLFFSDGSSAGAYAAKQYHQGGAGNWLNTDFLTDLKNRGLIGSKFGPALQNFPYFEDAGQINGLISSFMAAFVKSYYKDDAAVKADAELRNFVKETSVAKVINFPSAIATRVQLVEFLTHFALSCSAVHGVTNGNDPVRSSASLPYHPMAFYQPLPTTKGLKDLVPFMPNLTQSTGQIVLLSAFNRPFISSDNIQGSNRTLLRMFDSPEFLKRASPPVRQANELFKEKMGSLSKAIQSRRFDKNGLSQGMPFIWNVLDPAKTSFYLTV